MVSRRKILSRSRDDLNTEQPAMQEEEEDVWYQRDKLYKVRFETGANNHVFRIVQCGKLFFFAKPIGIQEWALSAWF